MWDLVFASSSGRTRCRGVIAFALGSVFAIVGNAAEGGGSSVAVVGSERPSISAIAAALRRTESHFSGRAVRGDVGFLLGQATLHSGRKLDPVLSPDVPRTWVDSQISAEAYLWSIRHAPLPQVALSERPLVREELSPAQLDRSRRPLIDHPRLREVLDQDSIHVVELMTAVSQCRPGDRTEQIFGTANFHYVVTHQIVGYLIAALRGCVSPPYEPHLEPYVRRMLGEFVAAGASQSDIQLQRAATLLMVGAGRHVPGALIAALVETQSPDGLWRFDEPMVRRGIMPPEHTSALAYFILSAIWAEERSGASPGDASGPQLVK